jgi:hypothetical protein
MRYRIPWPESEGIMTTPIRIQRLRTKGFNLQAASMAANGLPCVYVVEDGAELEKQKADIIELLG